MRIRGVWQYGLVAMLAFGTGVRAQNRAEGQVAAALPQAQCTDLSRRFPQPCPERPSQALEASGGGTLSFERTLPSSLFKNQVHFWTSPVRMRVSDLRWALPLSGVMAVTIAADSEIEKRLPEDPALIRHSNDAARYGVVAASSMLAGTYLLGKLQQNERLSQTAWMGGEAALSSLLPAFVVKSVTSRARPENARGNGFWQHGDSFPSEHATAAWSIASVFAHEYPGLGTELLAYGAASAMSTVRVLGRKHFTSDVILASALGWWFGRQVYRSHRLPEEDRSLWGNFVRTKEETARDPASMGSPYVPLDSWIYPAFDRLAALGYAPTAFVGLRPWTRMECARLLEEIREELGPEGAYSGDAAATLGDLEQEFALELRLRNNGHANIGARLESVYTRVSAISGPPLSHDLYFGRTVVNDFGRPYGEGFNSISGAAAAGTLGPLNFYVRGEYQQAAPPLPIEGNARSLIESLDGIPLPSPVFRRTSRGRLVEAYVGLNLKGWEFSFGRQSLWWGPGRSASLIFSNNTEPFPMIRVSRTTPVKIPRPLRFLTGPVRSEVFLGRLEGHRFVRLQPTFVLIGERDEDLARQPSILGAKVSFKPTRNLEYGFSLTSLFAGPTGPVTLRTIARTFSPVGSNSNRAADAGDRRTGFDFSYRIPKLRRWLTLFAEAMAEDEPSPIAYPRRSAMLIGLHVPQVPRLGKLEIRAEGSYTDLPGLRFERYFYENGVFANGYTNNGAIIGSWVGRQGYGWHLAGTYWFSAARTLTFAYRDQTVAKQMFGGGGLQDYSATANLHLQHGLWLSSTLQVENWQFPLLRAEGRRNVTGSLQLTYTPGRGLR
jgi:hypothetical protein